jgi:hypothetical protein
MSYVYFVSSGTAAPSGDMAATGSFVTVGGSALPRGHGPLVSANHVWTIGEGTGTLAASGRLIASGGVPILVIGGAGTTFSGPGPLISANHVWTIGQGTATAVGSTSLTATGPITVGGTALISTASPSEMSSNVPIVVGGTAPITGSTALEATGGMVTVGGTGTIASGSALEAANWLVEVGGAGTTFTASTAIAAGPLFNEFTFRFRNAEWGGTGSLATLTGETALESTCDWTVDGSGSISAEAGDMGVFLSLVVGGLATATGDGPLVVDAVAIAFSGEPLTGIAAGEMGGSGGLTVGGSATMAVPGYMEATVPFSFEGSAEILDSGRAIASTAEFTTVGGSATLDGIAGLHTVLSMQVGGSFLPFGIGELEGTIPMTFTGDATGEYYEPPYFCVHVEDFAVTTVALHEDALTELVISDYRC